MSPATHLLISWSVANFSKISRKDRALVTLSGIIPDIDGLGLIVEIATRHSENPLNWWTKYHHVFAHNLGFCLLLCFVFFWIADRRRMTLFLAVVCFHLHLLGDLIGARGPEGYQWPIHYLQPFSDKWQLTWQGQWELNAWPNFIITLIFIGLTLFMAWKKGFSIFEVVFPRADRAVVRALRSRFGHPS
jgi:hypothetical protein